MKREEAFSRPEADCLAKSSKRSHWIRVEANYEDALVARTNGRLITRNCFFRALRWKCSCFLLLSLRGECCNEVSSDFGLKGSGAGMTRLETECTCECTCLLTGATGWKIHSSFETLICSMKPNRKFLVYAVRCPLQRRVSTEY
ncbi:hypothetical protein CEXT_651391 [Caerostris extrusa]|uniref:Uncharacterized protein n=1 Tax=Caerostris extrusa TaxID=172846 RepID=A0AAV4T7B7_CAEEX|nr:hypothetical protein CEXT_651391 [Caerostris extrusa]